jgi:hypothetical protein
VGSIAAWSASTASVSQATSHLIASTGSSITRSSGTAVEGVPSNDLLDQTARVGQLAVAVVGELVADGLHSNPARLAAVSEY